MSWAGSDTGRHRAAISERKVSWHVCVSGSSVRQSAGLVVCNCMVPGLALGGILAFSLLCAGLPSFAIKKINVSHSIQLLLLLLLAVTPVLCTGRPSFLFTLNRLFQSLCLALLSHATAVPVCMCVTHHLPFYWFWNLLPFLFHFPPRRTI